MRIQGGRSGEDMAGEGADRLEPGRSPQKRTTLSREQLGIADAVQDVFETADDENGSEGARGSHPAEEQQLLRDLETMRKARREDRPAAPAPIDPAPLEPAASRALFQARDAVCLPPQSDFSFEAHARKRDEWLILGKREHRLETPLDRFTRLLAEAQALERCQCVPTYLCQRCCLSRCTHDVPSMLAAWCRHGNSACHTMTVNLPSCPAGRDLQTSAEECAGNMTWMNCLS